MAYVQKTTIDKVGLEGPGLVFIVYPEAISMMTGSVFWSIIFFIMLITLGNVSYQDKRGENEFNHFLCTRKNTNIGLDSTFGGLEAMITGIADEYPRVVGRHREIFVLFILCGIYICALPTMTYVSISLIKMEHIHIRKKTTIKIKFHTPFDSNSFPTS